MRLSYVVLASCITMPVLAGDRLLPFGTPGRSSALDDAAEAAPDFTFRKDIEEVRVNFLVLDRRGIPLTDLRPEDLHVFENSVRVHELTSFERELNSPLNILVLLDCSESLDHSLPMIVERIGPSLRAILQSGRDSLSFATFDSRLQNIYAEAEPGALSHITAKGPTAIFDTLVQISDHYIWPQHSGANERRALLLVSDGEDNLSYHTLGQAVASLNKSQTSLFALQPKHPTPAGTLVLRTLAEETGGAYFYVPRSGELDKALASISSDLQSGYSLVYRRPALSTSTGYREIRIVPADRTWTVRSRAGYFARPR